MNPNENNNDRFEALNEEILEFIDFTSKDQGTDPQKLLEDIKDSTMFKEFEILVKKYNETTNKEDIEHYLIAFRYRMQYKFTTYNVPICSKEDYKLFIKNVEILTEKALQSNKQQTLMLLHNFLLLILPVIEKNKISPSETVISALTKKNFEDWVKNQVEELKEHPIEIMRYMIDKQILDVEGPVWDEYRKIKKNLLNNEEVREMNAQYLVNEIKDHYEAFRIANGMLIGLFDIAEGVFDNNLKKSYFGDKFNTDLGLYSKRKTQENSRLKNDNRKTLKKYIKDYGCIGFKDFFEWFMKQIKPIRLTGAHHLPLIKQDNIANYKYKIKYKRGIKEVNLGFIKACKTGIDFFLNFIHWVGSYYFFSNVKE